jgi:hypothetical protein
VSVKLVEAACCCISGHDLHAIYLPHASALQLVLERKGTALQVASGSQCVCECAQCYCLLLLLLAGKGKLFFWPGNTVRPHCTLSLCGLRETQAGLKLQWRQSDNGFTDYSLAPACNSLCMRLAHCWCCCCCRVRPLDVRKRNLSGGQPVLAVKLLERKGISCVLLYTVRPINSQ